MLAGMRPDRVVLLAALLTCTGALAADRPKLTAYERAQGWRMLFDGSDASSWRGYRAEKLPAHWQVREGTLACGSGSGVVSTEEFADFELTFDWRVATGGRGEVLVRVSEDAATPDQAGPRMLLSGHGETIGGNGLTGPDRKVVPQFDVWYRAKILVFGNVVEHWINGDRVLSYALDSAAWRQQAAAAGVKASRAWDSFRTGRIALVGENVEFRNIKVRPF